MKIEAFCSLFLEKRQEKHLCLALNAENTTYYYFYPFKNSDFCPKIARFCLFSRKVVKYGIYLRVFSHSFSRLFLRLFSRLFPHLFPLAFFFAFAVGFIPFTLLFPLPRRAFCLSFIIYAFFATSSLLRVFCFVGF